MFTILDILLKLVMDLLQKSITGYFMVVGEKGGVLFPSPSEDVRIFVFRTSETSPKNVSGLEYVYRYAFHSYVSDLGTPTGQSYNCIPFVGDYFAFQGMLSAKFFENIYPFLYSEKVRMESLLSTRSVPRHLGSLSPTLTEADFKQYHVLRRKMMQVILEDCTKSQLGFQIYSEGVRFLSCSELPSYFPKDKFISFLLFELH